MFEPDNNNAHAERSVNRKLMLLGLAALYVVVSLFFIVQLNRRLAALEGFAGTSVEDLRRQVTAVGADWKASAETMEANWKASAETIASKVGLTQRQLAERSAELKHYGK